MGLIFNGHDFGDLLRVNPTRSILPEVDVSTEDVSGMDGAVLTEVKLKPLTIEVDVLLQGSPKASLMGVLRDLAPYLYYDEPKPLVLPDEPDLYYMAVFSGASELDRPMLGAKATLSFYCADPIAYGAHRTAKDGEIEVGGTMPSWPTVTGKPTDGSTAWRVTNTNGDFVEVVGAFNGSNVVVVDMEGQSATIDGASAEVTIESDFFQIRGSEKITATTSCTLEWDERWL